MADWKYFVIELIYQAPMEQVSAATPDHRTFLKTGYEKGWLLLSGPQVPRMGGIIIGRAPTHEDLEAFFANDPFQVRGIATYRFVQFDPVWRQAILEDWISQ